MRKRATKVAVIVAAALVVAAGLWFILAPRVSDEQQIASLASKVEHGVETKSAEEILDCVSPEYQDSEGLTRTDIWKLVMQWVRSPDRAEVAIQKYEIKVNGKTATGTFDVQAVVEHEHAYQVPLNLTVTVQFEKRWRRWHRVWVVKSLLGPPITGVAEEFI
jgi:hypothetical protein